MIGVDDAVKEDWCSASVRRRKQIRPAAKRYVVSVIEDYPSALAAYSRCELEWPNAEGHLCDRNAATGSERGSAAESLFSRLVEEWNAGRGHTSKIKDMAMHPAYQRIIGMGEQAIPLILEEMRHRPSHWTWALRAITGDDPVPKESRGKLKEMANAWIEWGIERGYIE